MLGFHVTQNIIVIIVLFVADRTHLGAAEPRGRRRGFQFKFLIIIKLENFVLLIQVGFIDMLDVLGICQKLILTGDANNENHAIEVIEMASPNIGIKESFIAIDTTGIWCLSVSLNFMVHLIDMIPELDFQSESILTQLAPIHFIRQNILIRNAIVRAGHVLINRVIIDNQAIQIRAVSSLQMANKLPLALELLQALKANIPRQRMILFPHVTHEKFVAGELFVAALAGHVLCLFKEIEVA
jgi:hypothetical protein